MHGNRSDAHRDALVAAYVLRHRLRMVGAVYDAWGRSGPLVGPRHAAYMLGVDESRVRRLIAAGGLDVVELPGGFRLVPVRDLLDAPTPCERGRPLVVYPDGSVRRDDGGREGLRVPIGPYPGGGGGSRAGREKNNTRTPGRNAGGGKGLRR